MCHISLHGCIQNMYVLRIVEICFLPFCQLSRLDYTLLIIQRLSFDKDSVYSRFDSVLLLWQCSNSSGCWLLLNFSLAFASLLPRFCLPFLNTSKSFQKMNFILLILSYIHCLQLSKVIYVRHANLHSWVDSYFWNHIINIIGWSLLQYFILVQKVPGYFQDL